MKKLVPFIFVLIGFHSFSCGVKPGFEALSIYDYFKAKQKFEKASKSDLAAASYGLATIYFRSDNPFHNYYYAYDQLRICDSAFSVAKDKKKEKWLEFGVNEAEIIALKQQVSDALFSQTKSRNSIRSYQDFIDSNNWSIYLHEAIKLRDDLEFVELKKANKSAQFASFLELRPNSHVYNQALELFYKLEYDELTEHKTSEEYVAFIASHTGSPYYELAQNELFKNETKSHTMESYVVFIETYPLNRNVDDAWRLLYDKYTSNYSAESIEAFQKAYPEYPFQQEIENELVLIKERFYPQKKGSLWGFTNEAGFMKIEPVFDHVLPFNEGLAIVEKDGMYGFINKMGSFVIPPLYDEAENFSDGLAIVSKSEQLGVIDRSGKKVIDFGVEDVSKPKEGIFYVMTDDTYAYYNIKGEKLTIGIYQEVSDFHNGVAIVAKDDLFGAINVKGGEVLPFRYDELAFYAGGFKCVENNITSIISKAGDTLTKDVYDFIGESSEGLAYVEKDGLFGFIDSKYNLVIPIKYPVYVNSRNLSQFKNGSSRVVELNKMGLIDKSGGKLAPYIFNYIGYFDSLIPIIKEQKWGFCNENINKVIDYQFDHAEPFVKSHSIVEQNGQMGLIDVHGTFVINPEYDKMYRKDGMILARKNGMLWFVFDESGVQLTKVGYQTVQKIENYIYLLESKETSRIFKLKQ